MKNHRITTGRLSIGETIIGFTLAEVLITLTIIGVIAALTIPSLIQNIQDAQLKTAWKEDYSIINQDITRMVSDQGGSIKGICADTDSNCLKNVFANYVSSSRNRNANQGSTGCWPNALKYLSGNTGPDWTGAPCLALPNGMSMTFSWATSNCTTDYGSGSTVIPSCGYITVDVNGPNPPNMVGKDIFQAYIQESGIKAAGIPNSVDRNSCFSPASGWSCSYEYLKQ